MSGKRLTGLTALLVNGVVTLAFFVSFIIRGISLI